MSSFETRARDPPSRSQRGLNSTGSDACKVGDPEVFASCAFEPHHARPRNACAQGASAVAELASIDPSPWNCSCSADVRRSPCQASTCRRLNASATRWQNSSVQFAGAQKARATRYSAIRSPMAGCWSFSGAVRTIRRPPWCFPLSPDSQTTGRSRAVRPRRSPITDTGEPQGKCMVKPTMHTPTAHTTRFAAL